MAQMRELAPRLQSMKEKFGDDKQKMQKAMMELYKTEKINPLRRVFAYFSSNSSIYCIYIGCCWVQ